MKQDLRMPPAAAITAFIIFMIVFAFFLIRRNIKRRKAQLLAVRTECERAAKEEKTIFLSHMSHELQTRIHSILDMNEMAFRISDDKEVKVCSADIRNTGEMLLEFVNNALDLAKIENGEIGINSTEYELAVMLNDIVTAVTGRAETKGLSLKLDFDRNIPKILYGDEFRIRQVIMILLNNAVMAAKTGSVSFELGYEQLTEENESILLQVKVKYTGIGFTEEDLQKLFSKDAVYGEIQNRSAEGTGFETNVGMSAAMNLLKMMGSELEADSNYEKGSCFGFCIKQQVIVWEPLGDYEESFREKPKKKRKEKAGFTAPKARILAVDDNLMNLVVIGSLIKPTGSMLDTVDSGDEAIKLSGQEKYDLIFLDHLMPGKDGIETLREIRQNPQNPNQKTPVVCLTANAVSAAKEKYLTAGFDDHLAKPVNSKKMETMMLKYLPEDKVILNTDREEDTRPVDLTE